MTAVIIIIFGLAIDAMILSLWGMCLGTGGLEFCNPFWWYDEKRLSIFSSIFTTILISISVLPYAICYWFYKLCTIKRR